MSDCLLQDPFPLHSANMEHLSHIYFNIDDIQAERNPAAPCAQVEQQLAEAMEQLRGLGADMEKKREVSQRVKKLRKDIADRVRLRCTAS